MLRRMKYQLFLFDLDDTLLDFRASERLAFMRTLAELGLATVPDALFSDYQDINVDLWRQFERGEVSKDLLKVERFRRTFAKHHLDLDPERASPLYLDGLADSVVLIAGALDACAELAALGEVGVITNGIEAIQHRRIQSSGLADHISFVATSEACGHAKPDVRFFDFAVRKARAFDKATTVIVGDRLDADILGANRFGIESCWFNPHGLANETEARPSHEIDRLVRLGPVLRGQTDH